MENIHGTKLVNDCVAAGAIKTSKTMLELLTLWKQLGDVPTVFEGEDVDTIEEVFLHFPIGTHREEIWHWFEQQNPEFIVGEIMCNKRQN